MKYVITDKNEVAIGSDNTFHAHLADGLVGKVVGAGYCRGLNGTVEVYGSSIGFNIDSKPGDVPFILAELNKLKIE